MKETNSSVKDVALRWLQYSNKDLTDATYLINKKPSSPAGCVNRPQKRP